MDTDGFTLNWNNGASAAWLIQYMAIGGGDVTAAASGTFTPLDDGLVPESITGVGFQPDLLMFLSIDSNTVNGNADEADRLGFAGFRREPPSPGATAATRTVRQRISPRARENRA
jgi:hypothetical protein